MSSEDSAANNSEGNGDQPNTGQPVNLPTETDPLRGNTRQRKGKSAKRAQEKVERKKGEKSPPESPDNSKLKSSRAGAKSDDEEYDPENEEDEAHDPFSVYSPNHKKHKEIIQFIQPGRSAKAITHEQMKEKVYNRPQGNMCIASPTIRPVVHNDGVIEFTDHAPPIADHSSKKTIWIDIRYPSHETVNILQETFRLHPLTCEDVLTADETRQKHEMYANYRFLTFSEAHYVPGSNILNQIDLHIIVLDDVVLTFHHGPIQAIQLVVDRLKTRKYEPRSSADWIMYALMDAITDMFFHLVEQLVMEVRALDELVLLFSAGEQSDLLRRVGVGRKRMTFLRTQMSKKKDVLQALVVSDTDAAIATNIYTLRLPKEIKVYLRDVIDGLYTMLDEIESARETLNNLNNTYLARVSIEVAEASNRMNVVMKKFNAIATILLPMTVVTGLWGMNVPGQAGEEVQPPMGWFFGILGGMVLFAVLAIIIFRKIRWL